MPVHTDGQQQKRIEQTASAVPPTPQAARPPAGGSVSGEPPAARGRSRLEMFGSLRERNYRLFASGQVVSNIGTWMQRVAQDWLVLELSGKSPIALGVAAALQFLPVLLFSAWAGVFADRLDKRKLLIVVQAGMGISGLVLGLLDVAGVVALWHVYLLCFLLGCFSSCDAPIRQAFVVDMVGRKQVANAVALNSMTFNLARIVGPAVAGVMITWIGTGWVFLINAGSFVGVITGLVLMNPAKLYTSARVARSRGQLTEGLRYVLGRPDIMVVLVLVFSVSAFGLNFMTTLANAAANVFHRNASGYGLLSTLLAVGTLSGAVLAARRSTRGRPRLRVMLVGATLFGLSEAACGIMPNYLTFGLMLIPVGIFTMTFTTAANATVQLSVSPQMRGRVMGLYMLVFLGSNPVGGPLTGWMAAEFGGRSPFVIGGVLSALSALVCAIVLARRGGVAVPRARLTHFLPLRRA